jgi:ATP-dependent Clp protease adaptor protein ClpS
MSEILTPDIVRKPEAEADEPQLQRPPMFRVIMLNDDYTPMEFVIDVLVRLFHKSPETANQLMLQVHNHGSAVCGVYPYDIAESKMSRVEIISRNQGHPLRCMMEQDVDD